MAIANATVYTAQQRCQVVLAERAVLLGLSEVGNVPNTKVADLMTGFKTVPGLDTFRLAFVDAAVTSDQLIKNKRAMQAFEYSKRQGFTSPMNSAYKTEQLVRKGGDDDGVAVCTELFVDQCKSKYVDISGIPLEHLCGEIGNMLRVAYDLAVYLLGLWLSSFVLPKTIEGIIVKKCSSLVLVDLGFAYHLVSLFLCCRLRCNCEICRMMFFFDCFFMFAVLKRIIVLLMSGCVSGHSDIYDVLSFELHLSCYFCFYLSFHDCVLL